MPVLHALSVYQCRDFARAMRAVWPGYHNDDIDGDKPSYIPDHGPCTIAVCEDIADAQGLPFPEDLRRKVRRPTAMPQPALSKHLHQSTRPLPRLPVVEPASPVAREETPSRQANLALAQEEPIAKKRATRKGGRGGQTTGRSARKRPRKAPLQPKGNQNKTITPSSPTEEGTPMPLPECAPGGRQTRKPIHNPEGDFWNIQDFAPPLATLNLSENALIPKHKPSILPLDLSGDQHVDQLHPAEQRLASTLRFGGQKYLLCKRQFFRGRVQTMRNARATAEQRGLNARQEELFDRFTKTAAQQICNVDVNKASILYDVYKSVGWLKREHFVQFLD